MSATSQLCARCGKPGRITARWPDGVVCWACYRAAYRSVGRCAQCGQRRVLPGRQGGHRLCGPCAGIDGFACDTCGATDERMRGINECVRCGLRRRLPRLLDAADHPTRLLAKLIDALCSVRSVPVVERWLQDKPLRDTLGAVARGELELAHDTFLDLAPSAKVDHVRDLLIDHGLLPARNRELLRFEHWSRHLLDNLAPVADRHVIATYTTWHHHRRLARQVEAGTLTPTAVKVAHQQIHAGVDFLAWLREHGTTLAECRQAHVDRWLASGPTTRRHGLRFLTWARRQRLCRPLEIPTYQQASPASLPDDQRVDLVARLFNDDTLPVADRVAGLLVLLYAQPATRVSRLRLDAITSTPERTTLRLGDEDIPLPPPLDGLVAQLATRRHHAGATADDWLFPGRIPHQPISPNGIRGRLRAAGVTRAARIGAFQHLAQHVPAPVLADLIGYNRYFTAETATALAADWATYAALRIRQP